MPKFRNRLQLLVGSNVSVIVGVATEDELFLGTEEYDANAGGL